MQPLCFTHCGTRSRDSRGAGGGRDEREAGQPESRARACGGHGHPLFPHLGEEAVWTLSAPAGWSRQQGWGGSALSLLSYSFGPSWDMRTEVATSSLFSLAWVWVTSRPGGH